MRSEGGEWELEFSGQSLWSQSLGMALRVDEWNGMDENIFGAEELKRSKRGRDFCMHLENGKNHMKGHYDPSMDVSNK